MNSTVTMKRDVMRRIRGHFEEFLTDADLMKCKKPIAMVYCVFPHACRSKSGGGSIKRIVANHLS
jgi:hypothetical protein